MSRLAGLVVGLEFLFAGAIVVQTELPEERVGKTIYVDIQHSLASDDNPAPRRCRSKPSAKRRKSP